jgi:hypothetical protein
MQGHSEEENPDRHSVPTDRATKPNNGSTDTGPTESIDSAELARRWNVPVSWIRDQVRSRAMDPLPHINFGKYRSSGGVPTLKPGFPGV